MSKPLMRSLRVVLSNGASITVPSSLRGRAEKPYFLNFDIHNHSVWRHNIKAEVEQDSASQEAPDRTRGFYDKFTGSNLKDKRHRRNA
ncbi:hypothetical protein CHLRE_07g334025v5 [Chlamydomonas reinhardtii]|uniref:Uncharacterized protein n=1 Tax=Chlamydomonas reinhardtii TaxID=3055 RepID=A0A2K3DK44_CHLRE|nr:uncharacterized protein CHLRE_07g334025v5 [Chlamydomonas reinhardtii]PNW80893.1 hypothetical protein CHLRE_07g334025v5 [Chlamydomonas reinhardtii]